MSNGFSFLLHRRPRALGDFPERVSRIEIAPLPPSQETGQPPNDSSKRFSLAQSKLKKSLPGKARLLQVADPVSCAADDRPHSAGPQTQHSNQTKTATQDTRPVPSRHRTPIKVPSSPNEVGRAPDADRYEHKQAGTRKPGIVVIHPRIFFRDCFVRCLEVSYQSHDILAFASISAWRASPELTTSTPSVIVFFVDDSNSSSVADLEFLEATATSIPVVIMSDIDDANYVMRALKSGARGYIPTSLPFNIAVEAVRLVEAGGTFVPVSSLELDRSAQATVSPKSGDILTERQLMVVEALCRGMANKQIAYQLSMSEHTVKVHLRHIMRKLKVRNRTEVAVLTKDFFERPNEVKWPSPDNGSHKDRLSS